MKCASIVFILSSTPSLFFIFSILYTIPYGGDHYTTLPLQDFTKVLLLCIFYSAFYPLIYFLGAAILFIQYWMDKFLLLRSWKRQPSIGPQVARFGRKYFTTGAIVIGAIFSAFAYAKFPFTYLCICDDDGSGGCGSSSTTEFTNVTINNADPIDVNTTSVAYKFCDQSVGFPPIPGFIKDSDKWMTDSQEELTRMYGWTCLVLLIVYIVGVLGEGIVKSVLSLWKGVYKPSGMDQQKDFSSCISFETFGYIPQLRVPGFHFPLLACDIDGIDVNLIGWRDPYTRRNVSRPHENYDDHNLIYDVPTHGMKRYRHAALEESSKTGSVIENRPIFSIVKHWPPSWATKENSGKEHEG